MFPWPSGLAIVGIVGVPATEVVAGLRRKSIGGRRGRGMPSTLKRIRPIFLYVRGNLHVIGI